MCTLIDFCDGYGGCMYEGDQECDDVLFCNGLELCNFIVGCEVGILFDIDDGLVCISDYCDELMDVVVYVVVDINCDDGNVCTVGICDVVQDCI